MGGRLHSRGKPPDRASFWFRSDVAEMLRTLATDVEGLDSDVTVRCSVSLEIWHAGAEAPETLRVSKGKRKL